MDRNLQILGLIKKAGLLAVGAVDTAAAARAGKARMVISSSDASESALRQAKKSAETGQACHVVVPHTSCELGNVVGRGSPSTVSILDTGLAARYLKGISDKEPERYLRQAEMLTRDTQIKPSNPAKPKKRMKNQALSAQKRTAINDKRRTVQ